MRTFREFFEATRLIDNPQKCKLFFRNMEESIKLDILSLTTFSEGIIPFRYLGIPLTSKKLFVAHCMMLAKKIVDKINHWSAHLLRFFGRLQLIKSVMFAITNFWMQCIPLSKKVIKKVEVVCHSFLWSCIDDKSRKSSIAWKTVYTIGTKLVYTISFGILW